MSRKIGIDVFSRRAFLRTAASAGAAAVAGSAAAQTAIDDILNANGRGNWDDQFDAKASRTATAVVSNNPIFGPGSAGHIQQEGGKPFLGDNFKATLRDLENRMRSAAANLEFEEAARLRDEIKRLKLLDLEFANEALSAPGEADRSAPKRVRAEAHAESAARFRKHGGKR